MKKITIKIEEFKVEDVLTVCFDVSKDKLNSFLRYRDPGDDLLRECEDEFRNRTSTIRRKLLEVGKLSTELGLSDVLVVCEPTGGYERSLLRTARREGFRTAYVNPESVHKLQVVESNDSGKSDLKDPRTIHTLTCLGKTLKHRMLPEDYLQLRTLHGFYEDEVDSASEARCHIHAVLHELFCDYSQSSDFIYTKTGSAILEYYSLNPYRIAADTWKQFVRKIQRRSRVRLDILEAIYHAAQSSTLHLMSSEQQEILEGRLRELHTDWERHDERKKSYRKQLETVFLRVREHATLQNTADLNEFGKARLIAQTGPLDDFDRIERLTRLAGMNLRQRQSGKYEGRLKISKKGRALLRKVLFQIGFRMIGQGRLYHEYYQAHINPNVDHTRMRTMVSVMRKILKMIHGLHRSNEGFDIKRVNMCKSQYAQLEQAAA
jgi:transposase